MGLEVILAVLGLFVSRDDHTWPTGDEFGSSWRHPTVPPRASSSKSLPMKSLGESFPSGFDAEG